MGQSLKCLDNLKLEKHDEMVGQPRSELITWSTVSCQNVLLNRGQLWPNFPLDLVLSFWELASVAARVLINQSILSLNFPTYQIPSCDQVQHMSCIVEFWSAPNFYDFLIAPSEILNVIELSWCQSTNTGLKSPHVLPSWNFGIFQ